MGLRWNRLADWLRSRKPRVAVQFVENVFGTSDGGRTALLVYLAAPFLKSEDWMQSQARHSNVVHCYQIARLLAGRGYVVDAAHYKLESLPTGRSYDCIIGLGPLCRSIAARHSASTKKIYIATGPLPEVARANQADRLAEVARRHGCRLPARPIGDVPIDQFGAFDLVACFGNRFVAEAYQRHGLRVEPFNNTAIREFRPLAQSFDKAKNRFMYFASGGQVLKGLDLLLDAFESRPDLELCVCGRFAAEARFVKCFERQLFHLPNVQAVGELSVGSPQFLEVAGACAYVILPSCAEGSVGTVVDCMHAGLVPVLTPECGIDLGDYGYPIAAPTLPAVQQALANLDGVSQQEWERRRSAVLMAARQGFSLDAFDRRWNEILDRAGV